MDIDGLRRTVCFCLLYDVNIIKFNGIVLTQINQWNFIVYVVLSVHFNNKKEKCRDMDV